MLGRTAERMRPGSFSGNDALRRYPLETLHVIYADSMRKCNLNSAEIIYNVLMTNEPTQYAYYYSPLGLIQLSAAQ